MVVASAVWFRAASLDRNSLFFDEIWHMELSTGRGSAHLRLPIDQLLPPQVNPVSLDGAPPWYSIWTHMDWVIHPPFYHTLLRGWRSIAGPGIGAARAFTILFSILSLLVLFDITRRRFDLAAAIWACALMAASPTNINISQEVRGYTLLLLLGLIACWLMIRIEDSGPTATRIIALGATTLAMMLTHYFAVGAVAGLLAFGIIRLPKSARWKASTAIGMAILLFTIGWGPTLLAQTSYVRSTADIFLKEPSDGHFAHFLSRLIALPCRMLLDAQLNVSSLEVIGGGAIHAMIVCLLCVNSRVRERWMLWVCVFCGTVAPIVALDLLRGTIHLEYMQYTFVAGPAVIVVLSSLTQQWVRHAVPAIVLFLCLWSHGQAYPIIKPDARPICAYLDSIAKDDEPLVLLSVNPEGRDAQSWFLAVALYTHVLPRRIVCLTHPADRTLLDQFPAGKNVIVLAPFAITSASSILPGYSVEKQQIFPDAGSCLLLQRR